MEILKFSGPDVSILAGPFSKADSAFEKGPARIETSGPLYTCDVVLLLLSIITNLLALDKNDFTSITSPEFITKYHCMYDGMMLGFRNIQKLSSTVMF